MIATVIINGLDKAEATAKEILEHVDAIKKLQASANWPGVSISVELKNEADSGN